MSGLLYQTLDANESIFFQRELETIKAGSYDVLYPELKIASGMIIPISREADQASESITYRQFDQAGVAKMIANYADDLPASDVSGKEITTKIKSLGASFNYNINEIRASQKAGRSLPQSRAMAARRAIEQKIESIGFSGDSETGITGFINHPNIQEYILPDDGTGASTKFSTKTPDQILRDLNGMATQVSTVTKGVESPDTMLLSLSLWNLLSTTRVSTTSDTTILQFFLNTSPHIRNVEWLNQLTAASDNQLDDVIVMYRRDPSKLTFEVPLAYEQLPPQEKNLAFMIPVHARVAGVIVYYPLSIIKAQGAN